VAITLIGVLASSGVAGAATPTEINGSGSSWAYGAVGQWVSDVAGEGVQVSYTPDGDAQGRQDFANKVSDFAVTSEGFQGVENGVADNSGGRPYAYLPIASGGTSFTYQIKLDGVQVENLRLSGQTLTKIFTNQITNWDDPAITKDNNGVALPSLPIVPVVQSEGSGSTYQVTSYFATEFSSIWNPFAGTPGATEYFPRQGNQIAQNGSDAVMNYVSSTAGNGSIGYVEYHYPIEANYPVVKVLNSAGYYTLPTQYNVAVALEAAQINTDPSSPNYLLQNLDNVYTDPDSRTYPLSSYVYMIEPTGTSQTDAKETDGSRQALADFAYYAICQGQKEIGAEGYSALPVNLVEAAFGQIQKIQQADSNVDLTNLNITTCNNPTFVLGQPNTNYLAQIAPMPPACDQQGAGPCSAGVTPTGLGPTPTSTSANGGPGGGSASSIGSVTAAAGASGKAAGAAGAGGAASGTGAGAGSGSSSRAGASANSGLGSGKIIPAVLPLDGAASWLDRIAPWAAVALLAVFAVPVVVGLRRSRRSNGATRA